MPEVAAIVLAVTALATGLSVLLIRRLRREPPKLSGAEEHRERWVTTGDPAELEQMLKEME